MAMLAKSMLLSLPDYSNIRLILIPHCSPHFSTLKHGKIAPNHKDYVNLGGLSRTAIFHNVHQSLARLGTDYLDLLQIHRFDPATPIEETMKALHDLVTMGKVHYIGASSMWAYQFAQIQFCAEKNGWTRFVSMQNHYSLLYREEEREMNRFCRETGVGLIPVSCVTVWRTGQTRLRSDLIWPDD